jgi:hypothetical protein
MATVSILNTLSTENLAVQDGLLFKELVSSINFLRTDGTYTTSAILESGISDRLYTRTKMKLNVLVNAKAGFGAYIILPTIDKNHPFIDEVYRRFFHSREGFAWVQGAKKAGFIDPKRGQVGGIFSEIAMDIHMGVSLFQDKRFTDEELASIILHEAGHAYTYFLNLGTTVISGLAAGQAARQVMNADDYVTRKKVIEEAERALGIEVPNSEELARMRADKSADGIQMVILTETSEKQKTETGHRVYEMRACEQIADEFAVKHGAGRSLVTALDKLGRIYGFDSTYRSMPMHIIVEMIKVLGFLFVLFFGQFVVGFFLILVILLNNPMERAYDKPEQRARLIRQRLVDQMKDQTLDKAKIKELQDDVQAVDAVIAGAKDKSGLIELFWENFMSEGAKSSRQIAFNKRLEELLYNDLFSEAASYRTQNA